MEQRNEVTIIDVILVIAAISVFSILYCLFA